MWANSAWTNIPPQAVQAGDHLIRLFSYNGEFYVEEYIVDHISPQNRLVVPGMPEDRSQGLKPERLHQLNEIRGSRKRELSLLTTTSLLYRAMTFFKKKYFSHKLRLARKFPDGWTT